MMFIIQMVLQSALHVVSKSSFTQYFIARSTQFHDQLLDLLKPTVLFYLRRLVYDVSNFSSNSYFFSSLSIDNNSYNFDESLKLYILLLVVLMAEFSVSLHLIIIEVALISLTDLILQSEF